MKKSIAAVFSMVIFSGSALAVEVKKCKDAPGGVVNTCSVTSYRVLSNDLYWKGITRSRVGDHYPFETKVILDLYGCIGNNCSNFTPKGSKTKNIRANGTWNFSVDSSSQFGSGNRGCSYAVTRVIRVSNRATVVNSRTPAACV